MKRVLLVGLDPATVDFSDPALPPGMNAEKIHSAVSVALADMAQRGWEAENCFIIPDETAVPAGGPPRGGVPVRWWGTGRGPPPPAEPAGPIRGLNQRHSPRRSERGHRLQHPAGGHWRHRCALDLSGLSRRAPPSPDGA